MSTANTEKGRTMRPPVLIEWCPGGGGHYWAMVNPSWFGQKQTVREQHWCSDHEVERKAWISAQISEARRRQTAEFAKMPVPKTKRCANPEPRSHDPGAVFPARSFYRRAIKHLDGTETQALDSRCKKCRREEAADRRARYIREDPDGYRKRRTKMQKKHRKNKRKGRRAFEREPDKQVRVEPVSDWLSRNLTHLNSQELAARVGVDEKLIRSLRNPNGKRTVGRSVVDRIGIAAGHPGLLNELYPLPLEDDDD